MKQQIKKVYDWLRGLPKRKQKEWRREAHKQYPLGDFEFIAINKNPDYWYDISNLINEEEE